MDVETLDRPTDTQFLIALTRAQAARCGVVEDPASLDESGAPNPKAAVAPFNSAL